MELQSNSILTESLLIGLTKKMHCSKSLSYNHNRNYVHSRESWFEHVVWFFYNL